jgi:3-oxoacyl-[acyl-carrier-protein] synthase-3
MKDVALRAPVRVAATGMYVPERIVTNDDIARLVETSDEWIVQRTGIRTRRRVAENEYAGDLAFNAVQDLVRAHPDTDMKAVDYVLVSSTTPDYVYPSLAALTQDRLGLPTTCGALDVSAACAGFCAILNIGAALIASNQARSVLLIATEALTRSVDYTDRATCVLFGDGAAAALIVRDERCALAGMDSGSDGSAGPSLYRTAMRSEIGGIRDKSGLLRQVGRDVYRWVLENIPPAIDRILDRAGMGLDEIDWFIPHSANMRMIEALCKRVGFPIERTLESIVEYGNTSAVSIPLALIPAVRNGTVKSGDRLLMIGFGGGLVSAGAVLTWL